MTLEYKARMLLLRAGIVADEGVIDVTELANLIGDRDVLIEALVDVAVPPLVRDAVVSVVDRSNLCWCQTRQWIGHTESCVAAQNTLRNVTKRVR